MLWRMADMVGGWEVERVGAERRMFLVDRRENQLGSSAGLTSTADLSLKHTVHTRRILLFSSHADLAPYM